MGGGHETSAEGEDRVQFRLTCPRHRAMFIDIVKREGVSDTADMERLRRRLAALVMTTYPGGYLHHIAEASCMGCAFEQSGPQCWAWVVDALLALIHGTPPPESVWKPTAV